LWFSHSSYNYEENDDSLSDTQTDSASLEVRGDEDKLIFNGLFILILFLKELKGQNKKMQFDIVMKTLSLLRYIIDNLSGYAKN